MRGHLPLIALLVLPACVGRGKTRTKAPRTEWSAECDGVVVDSFPRTLSYCSRQDPEPVFQTRDGSDHRVTLCEQHIDESTTMRSMVEEITFDDGTQVVLHNGGCGYFTMTWSYMLPGDETPVGDPAAWRLKASQLLRQTVEIAELPMESIYAQAADRLEAAEGLNFMEELVVSEGGIPTTLVLEGAGDTSQGRLVRLSLTTGPL